MCALDRGAAIKDFAQRLQAELARFGGPSWSHGQGKIEVAADNAEGFAVWAAVAADHITVGYDGWHDEFGSEEIALTCFLKGVFGRSRLAVCKRGGFVQSWTAEELVEGVWRPASVTGRLLFPFWRRREVIHLRNDRKRRE